MPRAFDELTCVDIALHRDDCGYTWNGTLLCIVAGS
jgi:hypothetical protein